MRHYVSLLLVVLMIAVSWQCTEKYPMDKDHVGITTTDGCVSCHTDANLLKQVAAPVEHPSENAGEG